MRCLHCWKSLRVSSLSKQSDKNVVQIKPAPKIQIIDFKKLEEDNRKRIKFLADR
jgi:hypothetical protein